MNEEIITRLENDSNVIHILESYLNKNNEEAVMIVVGSKETLDIGSDGEDILLNKNELENLIEKLQFYHSRME